MLSETLNRLYKSFRLMQYKHLFGRIKEKSGSLSATEAFAADVIHLLGTPTIKQFADYLAISQPNASYKVGNLVAKGYVDRVPSDDDKRESHLVLSEKYYGYMGTKTDFIDDAVKKLEEQYPPEKILEFCEMLSALNDALN